MPDISLTAFFEFCRAAVMLLFIWSWQAVLLLAITFLIAQFNRSRSAELRHKIWLAGLAAVVLLPLWSVLFRWFPIDQSIVPTQIEKIPSALLLLAANVNNSAEQSGTGWFDWLAVFTFSVWIIGISIYSIRFFIANRKMRRIVRNSQPIAESFYQCSDAKTPFLIPASVRLLSSSEISNPTLSGLFYPVILFPGGIEEWTTPSERLAIICHELAHLERYDHFTQILQLFIEAVFFFHPLIRYALNQLSFEREVACDEKVLASGIQAREYTEIILKVTKYDILTRENLQLTFTPKQQLNRRIDKIMNNRNQSLSKTWRFLLLVKTIVLLAVVVWFVTPTQTAGQSPVANNQPSGVSIADDQTTENFKKLYESIKEAMLKADKSTFESLFADDYTAVSARGTRMSKQQVIDAHIQKATADTKMEKIDFSDLQVKNYKDTVIVTYLAEMSGLYKGAKFSQKARITDVWEKNGDKWQSVASHASTVAQ